MRHAVKPMWAAYALTLATVALCLAVLTPAASAKITPKLTLIQTAGTKAGATQALGTDMAFSPSSTDSPKNLTITLPRGLLASASGDGGACLKWTSSSTPPAACEVGSGTATANLLGLIGAPVNLTFYLVAPPKSGDLAGLYVTGSAVDLLPLGQIGSTGGITVGQNASSLSIALTLPDSQFGIPIAISQINATFSAIRYPTTCPATPEQVSIAADSYSVSTVQTSTAPLTVTGCSSLPFAPTYAATFTKDARNTGVKILTTITQAADQAPNSSIALKFPNRPLVINVKVAKLLCKNVNSGTCTPAGSATAVSPLYPTPLTGKVYLMGQLLAPKLAIVFPSPFPISLIGTVDLRTFVTKFTGLPDIPLTKLQVALNGGSDAAFKADCVHPTGTSSATMIGQNGAKATVSKRVKIAGCPVKPKKKK
jgi:hypothetical protein